MTDSNIKKDKIQFRKYTKTFSLPRKSDWVFKEGNVLAFKSKVYIKLEFGVLTVYSDLKKAPIARLILTDPDAVIKSTDTSNSISVVAKSSKFTFLCDNEFEYKEWKLLLEKSTKWKLEHFYRVEKCLAEGATGKLYKATSVRTGKELAIKAVDKNHSRRGREAAIMVSMEHPNVLPALDVLESRAQICIAWPLLNSKSLCDLMDGNSMSELDARPLLRQILQGVSYIHSKNIVHRDIKPENIVVKSGSELVIRDFGLAEYVEPGGMVAYTGVFVGTPYYMAPEMLRSSSYDQKIDVWACGVILFEMLTGSKPFDEKDVKSTFNAIKAGEFYLGALNNCSVKASELVKGMLKCDPQERLDVKSVLCHEWFSAD